MKPHHPEPLRTTGNLPQKESEKPLGVLILHGFTSSLDCVNGLVPYLEERKIPYEMPLLRGHGKTPEALIGVKANDWYEDALNALNKLAENVDRIVVIGLSMGGLVALNLCANEHPNRHKICGCITWAAALGFCNRLAFLAKPLSLFVKMWPGQESFNDPECRKKCTNYPKFPADAFVELYQYAKATRTRLNQVTVPLCIIHSRLDQVVPYQTAEMLFDACNSPYMERHALEKSGHELGQDCESETVFKITLEFIDKIK